MARTSSRTIDLHRVVITGMGAVTPLGNDVATTWGALLKGVSGIGVLEGFDTSDLAVRIADTTRSWPTRWRPRSRR